MYKICTLLSSFGKKMYGQKVLSILPFRFIWSFIVRNFLIIPYELFHSFCPEPKGQKWVCIVTITNRPTHTRRIRSPQDTNSNPHRQYHRSSNSKKHHQETTIPRDGNEILLAYWSRDKQILQILIPAGSGKFGWLPFQGPHRSNTYPRASILLTHGQLIKFTNSRS